MQNNTFPTLFIGQNLIQLPRVDSTNNYLKGLLSNSEPLPEGTVIMAEEQFAGRGQLDNVWYAEPGKNLTFSLYLTPRFLPAEQQFLLNICISTALLNALNHFLFKDAAIKWPNDIFYEDHKIGGLLIENIVSGTMIKQSIIGIGLNINQQEFSAGLAGRATSLARILQRNVEIPEILTEICREIEAGYLRLKAGNYTAMQEKYVNNLYRLNKPARYRQNGEVFTATLTGVTNNGQLELMTEGLVRRYNFKEIEFII